MNWMVLPVSGAQLICPYLKCVAYAGWPPPPSTAHTAITLNVAPKTFTTNDARRRVLFILPSFPATSLNAKVRVSPSEFLPKSGHPQESGLVCNSTPLWMRKLRM